MVLPGFASWDGQPGILVVPYLEREVPVLVGPDGQPMVPLAALCRLLGLESGLEIRRVRRLLLWAAASLLPLRPSKVQTPTDTATAIATAATTGTISQSSDSRSGVVWCLPYPLAVGTWCWQVFPRVRDAAMRSGLRAFIDDTGNLSAWAWEITQREFEGGRRRLHHMVEALNACADGVERAQRLASTPSFAPRSKLQVESLALRYQALRDQVETFTRCWFHDAQGLPVVEAVHLAADGQIVDTRAVTLFGTFSHEDQVRLRDYEQAVAALLEALGDVTRQ